MLACGGLHGCSVGLLWWFVIIGRFWSLFFPLVRYWSKFDHCDWFGINESTFFFSFWTSKGYGVLGNLKKKVF